MLHAPLTLVSPEEAVALVQSGDRIFMQGGAMTPNTLIDALCERYKELRDVEILHIHTEGEAPYLKEPYRQAFFLKSCFVASNVRNGVNTGNGDYIPIFLSEIHQLFEEGILPLDLAFVQVSPPDRHGYCTLGVSVDVTLPAIRGARKVVALINPQVPRTHGDGIIHISQIDVAAECNLPIHESILPQPSPIEDQIGQQVAGLIENGATLQMGIGTIPNAVLKHLCGHRRLGIHTEMFSDGILPLIEQGVITGEAKKVKPQEIVTAFAAGSRALYDFVDDNPGVHFKAASFTNDTGIIRQNPKVTAINSAIEIDLTGQVCADTIGPYQFSGVGGQMDFIRGAALSPGGKPIFAINATTRKGISKIVPRLKPGAGITTTRAHVHYVATEYGVAYLYGKSLRERASALISIAHPEHREWLEREMTDQLRLV